MKVNLLATLAKACSLKFYVKLKTKQLLSPEASLVQPHDV